MRLKLRIKNNMKHTWYRQNIIAIAIWFFVISCLSVGYSILSQNLDISGEVVIRADKDIRVSGIATSITNCGYDNYNPKFTENSIVVNLSLPQLNCTIQYDVTVRNKGTVPMELINIINENYSNNDIVYEIDGYQIGDVLLPNTNISFTVTFKYSSSLSILPNNKDLGATIKLIWQEYDNNGDGDTTDFVYKGSCEEYIVPQSGLYILETWGADGGAVPTSTSVGRGGYSSGTVWLTKNTSLFVCVGGKGEGSTGGSYINKGGFNGGGDAKNSTGSSDLRTGGGGATDIRALSNSLYNRILVAGGGGGNSSHSANMIAGNGGNTTGGNGGFGKGGTQSSGGAAQVTEAIVAGFGVGGSQTGNTCGGGGSGWYGGGCGNGAGGGSGYVLTASSYKPSGYFTQYANYYIYNGVNVQHSQSGFVANPTINGHGHARITPINIDLTLNGNSEVTIALGSTYTDAGATLTINGVDKSYQIVTTGVVNTNLAGSYTITYTYTEPTTGTVFTISRTVNVILITTSTFAYTGDVQSWIVPLTGYYRLEVWGAQGGNGSTQIGGKGGYSTGIVYLTAGETVYIYVGGSGQNYNSASKNGGFNGGGNGNTYQYSSPSGGGATDMRINSTSLYSRIIVAGGGGGAGNISGAPNGGYGGGNAGEDPSASSAKGGTQTAGGASGANLITASGFGIGATTSQGGGGGGGWYGGGSSTNNYPGGGGSGYALSSSSYVPSGYILGGSYYMNNVSTIAGNQSMPTHDGVGTMTGNSNNGYAKISFLP